MVKCVFCLSDSEQTTRATFPVFSSSSYPSEEKKKRKPRHDKSNKVKPEPGEDEGVDNRWDNQRYFSFLSFSSIVAGVLEKFEVRKQVQGKWDGLQARLFR